MTRPGGIVERASASMEPLVIGLSVDFGMTASGVAFDDGRINPVHWSRENSLDDDVIRSKVPTTISYDKGGRIADWGFPYGLGRPQVKCNFKSLLDPQIWTASQQTRQTAQGSFDSLEMVRDCVRDYLTMLLESALRIISDKTMSRNLVINLTLTRPTTWTAAVVEDYRRIARKAFEKAAQSCSSVICLRLNSLRDETESHAAGAFVFHQNKESRSERGSVFFVLDVGGATTDPALLQAVHDSSGCRKLKPLMNPSIPGIRVGCVDLDNCLSDRVLLLLRSRWEHENVACDIEESPSVLSAISSTARALGHGRNWIKIRNHYSEDMAFPLSQLDIPLIPSNEEKGVSGLPKSSIDITRDDMKAIFNAALITPIRKHISEITQILSSLQRPQEPAFEISHVILCGGGGFIPRVYECVRDQMGPIVTRTNVLLAPSLGALHLVKDDVGRMHATLKVGTRRLGGGPRDIVWLTGVVSPESLLSKPPMFSQKWKHRMRPEVAVLRQQFVLVYGDKLVSRDREENWIVHLHIDDIASELQLGLFRSFEYRIALTLPTTTDVVTAINFSAFQVCRDGREAKLECNASKETQQSAG